ncbi:ABC transporter substrate-binding protein [Streptomyces cavernicola]|uniref:Extracellular solute-binding protein n=1 Tax=Streptomyces cavernicola TaxID=3043613 RepID=A0ABT6S5J3_9ACTN|nr:extracellular solute-binding protein [Streptomyces sp. B-S-A6]MDI3403369.1 extracellular solute-binding protein [Streptomyces sp. B-S-A6]
MAPLTRRRLLGLGAGGALATAVAGCASPGAVSVNKAPALPAAAPGETVTLTYWSWVKDLQKVLDIWNAKQPHIQVKATWIPSGNEGGYQKLHAALAAGGGPDIAQIEMMAVPEYLLQNGLVDLSRYGADKMAHNYDKALWRQVSFNGGVYGIPQDSGPMGFFHQPGLLDRVGGRPPRTWAEWAELAAEIRRLGSRHYLDSFAVSDGSVFTGLAAQAGAVWFRTAGDEWVVDMTDDKTLNVARFFDEAVDDDLVNVSSELFSPAWYAAAAEGRIVGATCGSWGDALVQEVSGGAGKWRVAPLPVWGKEGFGSAHHGGSTAAVLANSAHPAEALAFIEWLTSTPEGIDAEIEHLGIGWSPARHYIGAKRREPSEWFGGQRYNEEVFARAVTQTNPDWTWSPLTKLTSDALANGFRKKLTSGQSFVDSVAQAQSTVVRAFRDKGLRVREGKQ